MIFFLNNFDLLTYSDGFNWQDSNPCSQGILKGIKLNPVEVYVVISRLSSAKRQAMTVALLSKRAHHPHSHLTDKPKELQTVSVHTDRMDYRTFFILSPFFPTAYLLNLTDGQTRIQTPELFAQYHYSIIREGLEGRALRAFLRLHLWYCHGQNTKQQ